jgi:hypothetical protein
MNSSTAMIFGLLDTFFDEQASLREVQQILQRVLVSLHAMKMNGVSVLVVCHAYNVLPEERNRLFATLKTGMDRVYRLEIDEENKSRLFLEHAQPLAAVKLLSSPKTTNNLSEEASRLKNLPVLSDSSRPSKTTKNAAASPWVEQFR